MLNYRCKCARTLLPRDMKAIGNCGTVTAGGLRRTSIPIRWEQHTETATTKISHSTSLYSKLQTVVWSEKRRSSILAINEQRNLRKHVIHALEQLHPIFTLSSGKSVNWKNLTKWTTPSVSPSCPRLLSCVRQGDVNGVGQGWSNLLTKQDKDSRRRSDPYANEYFKESKLEIN